jgi:hypothetical protein
MFSFDLELLVLVLRGKHEELPDRLQNRWRDALFCR